MIVSAAVTTAIIIGGTYLISAAVSMGISYLLRKPIDAGERDFEINRTDTKAYLPGIYGIGQVGINRIFSDTTHDGSKLWIVGALCIGPIKRIIRVYFNKELVWYFKFRWVKVKTGASSGASTFITKDWAGKYPTLNPVVIAGIDKFKFKDVSGNALSPDTEYTITAASATDCDKKGELTLTISPTLTSNILTNYRVQFTTGEEKRGGQYYYAGKWANRCEIYPHTGKDAGEVDKALTAAFPDKWDNTHTDNGVANLVIALSYDIDYFPNGLPEIVATVEGMKVHDPRNPIFPNDAPFWSDNPALCIFDYISRGTYPWVSATRLGDTNPSDTTHTEYLLKYGLGAHYANEVLKNSIISEANFCDEYVSTTLELPKPVKCKVQDSRTEYSEDLVATVSSTPTITLTYLPTEGTLFVIDSANNFISKDADLDSGGYTRNLKVITLGVAYSGETLTCSYEYESSQGKLNAKTEYAYKSTYLTTYGESAPSNISRIVKTTKSDRSILIHNIPKSDNTAVTGIKLYRTKGGDLDNYYYTQTVDNELNVEVVDTMSDNGTGLGILTISAINKAKNDGTNLTQSIYSSNWNNSITNCVKQGDTFYFSYLNTDGITYTTDDKNMYIITASNGTINTALGYNSDGAGNCEFKFRKALLVGGSYTSIVTSGAIRLYATGTEIVFTTPRDVGTNLTSITANNNGTKQKRFTCNGVVDTGKDVKNNIEEILTSCRGNLFYESGKYSIFIRKASIPEDLEITENNIIGNWKWQSLGIKETCNVLKASWVNPKKHFQTDYVYQPPKEQLLNQYLLDDNGFENQKDIDLFFTNNKQMARQIAMVLRRELRQALICSCTVTEEALQAKIGNLLKVTHETPGWSQKLFWVSSVSISPSSQIELAFTEYDPSVYDYDVIDIDPAEGADTTLNDPTVAPDEVTAVTLTTERYEDKSIPNFRIRVNYTDPDSDFWHHSEVYIRKGEATSDNIYSYYTSIDTLNNGIFYIQPVEAFITYYVKIQSVSTLGVKQEFGDVDEYTHEVVVPVPEKIKGLEAFARGNEGNVYGKYFAVRWQAMSTSGYGDGTANTSFAQRQTTVYEGTRYFVEVALAYPDAVGAYLSGNKIYGLYFVVRSEVIDTNKYVYSYEDDIEDVNALFAPLQNNSDTTAQRYYNTYYGVPNRTVLIQVSAMDQYSQRGPATFIILTNPSPDMKDENDVNQSPYVYPEKNALRIEWAHPFQEYDISHFILKLAESYEAGGSDGLSIFTSAARWEANLNVEDDDLVYPTIPNGHIYKVTTAPPAGGTTGATEPSWPVPSSGTPHPTIANGTVTFTHNSVYLTAKIASLSTVTSSDDEINTINYVYTFRKLDPKKDYIAQVIPYDVYGRGNPSGIQQNNTRPFKSYDEDEENIIAPLQVGTPTMDLVVGSNNIKISWDLLVATDIKRYIVDWRGSGNGSMPTLAEVEQGYLDADNTVKCYGYTVQVDTDGQGSNKNWILIQDAKQGYTYWARVRAENTSYIKGAWSSFGTHVFLIGGVGADELSFSYKEYYFTGTLTATDYNTCTWTAGTLKFKKSDGTTTQDKTINSGNTGNLAGDRWLIWKGTGTSLEAITESDLFTSATYKDAVTIAWLIVNADTTQKLTIIPTQDKKNTIFSSSVIAANSIITAHLQASAVKASKIDVDGEITVGHSSGGKISIQDNSSVKRIALSSVNGSAPFIRVSKSGYNATTETDPDNLLFDSTYNYDKIEDSFLYTIPNEAAWQAKSVNAHTVDYGGTKYLGVQGSQSSGDGFTTNEREITGQLIQATGSSAGSNEPIWETFGYQYIQLQFRVQDFGSGNEGWVRVDRVCINASGSSQTFPTLVGMNLRIKVKAETIS